MSAVGAKRKTPPSDVKVMEGKSFNCTASASVELERRKLADGTITTNKSYLPLDKLMKRFRFVEQTPDLTLHIRLSTPHCRVNVSLKGSIRVVGASSNQDAAAAIDLVMKTLNQYCRDHADDQPWVHFINPAAVTSHWRFECHFEVSLSKLAEQWPQYVIYNVDNCPQASIKIDDMAAELTPNGIIICHAKTESKAIDMASAVIDLAKPFQVKRSKPTPTTIRSSKFT